jgi:hypothetical protein
MQAMLPVKNGQGMASLLAWIDCNGRSVYGRLAPYASATFTYFSGVGPKVDFDFKSAQFFCRKNYY